MTGRGGLMMRRRTNRIGKMGIFYIVAIAVLTAGFITGAVLSQRVFESNVRYRLGEIVEARRSSVERGIHMQMDSLEKCALQLSKMDADLYELAGSSPAFLQELTGADKVALTDMDGKGALAVGGRADISNSDVYAKVRQGERSAVCIGATTDEEDITFLMASVVEREDGELILAASYKVEDISEYLLRGPYTADACLLVDRQGRVLMRSERAEDWDDLIARISANDPSNALCAQQLAQMLQNESSGVIAYQYHGEKWYLAFAELGVNDWLLVYRVQAVELEYMQGTLASYYWAIYMLALAMLIWLAAAYMLDREKRGAERRLEEQNLRASRECLRILAGHPGAILCDTDLRTKKTYLYGSFLTAFGRDPVLTNFPFDAARVGMFSEEDAKRVAGVMDQARRGVELAQTDIGILNADGTMRWCRLRAYSMCDENGEPFRVISRIVDHSDGLKSEFPLEEDANTMSRHAAELRMNEKIQASPCALMLMDIDNSSRLVDKFGAEETEKILVKIIEELRRTSDTSDIVARLGGDEFAVLISGELDENALRERSAAMQKSVAKIGEQFDAPVTASIGTAVSPKDGQSFDELYFKADTAQYMAKQSGRKKLLIYREV